MRILVVNDDGINAKGIQAIAKRLNESHDVTVVAPESERSAASHAITLNHPLRIKHVHPSGMGDIPCHVVDGQPVDCTKVGITHLLGGEVDLLVSGINHGHNMGSDMLYSGTVAAALDAVIMGYPAMAVSIHSYYPQYLEAAADIAASLIDGGLFDEHDPGILYNLNVPDLPMRDIKGVRTTRQGLTVYEDAIEVRTDPRGNQYLWMAGTRNESNAVDDTDVSAVEHGYASITPVNYDWTAKDRIEKLNCKIQKIKLHDPQK